MTLLDRVDARSRCSSTSLRTGRAQARRSPYGLGVQSVAVDGPPAARPLRAGSSGPARSSAGSPTQHIAIAVLTNQSRTDPNPILASLLKSPCAAERLHELPSVRAPDGVPAAAVPRYRSGLPSRQPGAAEY